MVNLLSAPAFARLAIRTMRRRFIVAGVGLVLLVAAGGLLQQMRVSEAEHVLAVHQVETARLGAETQTLAPVRAFVSDVALQERTVETTMATEIYTSVVLDALREAAPPGLRLDALALTVAAAADPVDGATVMTPCPGPDPFNTRTVVACVTLSGTARDRAAVGALVIGLGKVDLFVEPFISTTTTADTAGVSFSGSVGLSREAFSGRYGVPAGTPTLEASERTDQ